MTTAALPASLTSTGWATTGGSGTTALYRPVRSSAQALAWQDGTKRRAGDMTGIAQADTHNSVLVATASDEQAETSTDPDAGNMGLPSPVLLQPDRPETNTTMTVVVAEDLNSTTEVPRTLSQEAHVPQEVLPPVLATVVGDTGGAPSPSHAMQRVPQGLMQQEQQ